MGGAFAPRHVAFGRGDWSAGVQLAAQLAALLALILLPAPRLWAAGPEVSIGAGEAAQGARVDIPISLTANGNTVSATETIIGYDNDALKLVECGRGPAAAAAAKNVLGPSGACADRVTACTVDADCILAPPCGVWSPVTVGVAGLNANPIPDGVLLVCSFEVGVEAAPGVYPLANEPGASDPEGNEYDGTVLPQVSGNAGSIRVLAGIRTATPSETPTAEHTRTPTPTPTCAPTGTPYCASECEPCPTIRPGCYAAACGACLPDNPCPPGEAPSACGSSLRCLCPCAPTTPAPSETPSPTAAESATSTPTDTSTATPTETAPATVTATHTATATGVPTASPSPPSATPRPCVGDCDRNGMVTVEEIVTGVNIALGVQPLSRCPAFDADDNSEVTVEELVTAVNLALGGCPAT